MLCSEDQHTYTKFCKVFVDCTVIIGNHDHKLQMCFTSQKAKMKLIICVIFNQNYDVYLELSHRSKEFFCWKGLFISSFSIIPPPYLQTQCVLITTSSLKIKSMSLAPHGLQLVFIFMIIRNKVCCHFPRWSARVEWIHYLLYSLASIP